MSLTNGIHESLPYIDREPSTSEREAAAALIASELSQETTTHSSLPPLLPSTTSSIINTELSRINSKTAMNAIDLARYEALEPPTTFSNSDERDPDSLILWREALQKAYTSQSYLSGRQTNLALLDKYGKNSWLIGNSQLEDELRGLERELAEKKTEIDTIVVERKNAQEAVGGEIQGLEESWKKGVGRVLEIELAAEDLRQETLRRRREMAR